MTFGQELKVMTYSWFMDNNCVKYYPDRTRRGGGGYKVMAQTQCEQTDSKTDRVNPINPISCCAFNQ